jgi:hypothetical protein
MDMTKAEQKLDADLRGARRALSDRQYHALERLLSQAALDARSLALLGPEGAAGIPVSHEIQEIDGTRHRLAAWDAPAGAGDSVEADRG